MATLRTVDYDDAAGCTYANILMCPDPTPESSTHFMGGHWYGQEMHSCTACDEVYTWRKQNNVNNYIDHSWDGVENFYPEILVSDEDIDTARQELSVLLQNL